MNDNTERDDTVAGLDIYMPSWDEFARIAAQLELGDPVLNTYLFRGHADKEWLLEPTIYHALNRQAGGTPPQSQAVLGYETSITTAFRAAAPIWRLPCER